MSSGNPRRDDTATGANQPLHAHRQAPSDPTAHQAAHEALAGCEAILTELDEMRQPVTAREWALWRAGYDTGHDAGYLNGRHALLDEAADADRRAWNLWLATHPNTDPRGFTAWQRRRTA